MATITGGSGDDTLTGTSGADFIDGAEGHDTLTGGGGDDTIRGGAGNDTLIGGAGFDTADYTDSTSGVSVDTSGTSITITGAASGSDVLHDMERILGSAFNDTFLGGAGSDTFIGGDGADTLIGGGGDDALYGGAGDDWIEGSDGDDLIYGGDGADVIRGDQGRDVIHGEGGNDTIGGGTQDDTIYGGSGHDIIDGNQGNDVIYGDSGDDTLTGANDVDVLYGGADNDSLFGLRGDDTLDGGAGDDTLRGGAGDDLLVAGDADLQDGDVAEYVGPASRYAVTDHGNGTITVSDNTGLDGVDTLVGFSLNQIAFVDDPLAPSMDLDGDDSSGAANGGYNAQFVEDGGAVAIVDSDLSITTPLGEPLRQAFISLTNPKDLDASQDSREKIFVDLQLAASLGLSVAGNGSDKVTISADGLFGASAASFEQLLRSTTYLNPVDEPTDPEVDRLVEFTVVDLAFKQSNPVYSVIGITSVNDPPEIGDPILVTTNEDVTPPYTVNLLANASDPEGDDLDLVPPSSVMVSDGRTLSYTLDLETGDFSFDPGQFDSLAVGETATITIHDYAATDGDADSDTVTSTIVVEGRNDAPVDITLGSTTVAENAVGAAIGTLTVTDPDVGDSHNLAVDDSRFEIVGGVLKLKDGVSLDHETESSVTVTISAADSEYSYSEAFTLSVTDVNEAPAITSSSILTLDENTAIAGTVVAKDDDVGDSITYSVTGGADDHLFAIDASTGVLSFIDAPNFEVPADTNADNNYQVEVTATDSSGSFVRQTLSVTVGDVNEAPVITSSPVLTLNENTTVAGTVSAKDEDAGDSVTYSIVGGADASLFTVNASTGVLSFVNAPNFEAPGDDGGNNVYDVVVAASDSSGTVSDTQTLTVTVDDVNEAPVITSSPVLTLSENSTVAGTVAATDEDFGDSITYSVTGNADDHLFSIDATTGVLSFVNAPNFEVPGDSNADNNYQVEVTATDSEGEFVRQNLTITVGDVNEAPTDIDLSNTIVAENAVGAAIGTLTVTDPDIGDSHDLTVDDSRFEIVGGVLKLKDGVSLDHETESSVTVTISAADSEYGYSEAFTLSVADVNEAPTDIDLSNTVVAENAVGAAIGTLTVTDPDVGDSHDLTVDDSRFEIVSGVLKLKDGVSLDHETESSVTVTISAADSEYGYSEAFTLSVTDVNEAPVITSSPVMSLNENTTVAGTVVASDEDNGDSVTYSIVGGVDSGLFTIDASTGVLSFVNAPDFETPVDDGADNVYNVEVRATDSSEAQSDLQALTITVEDVNEAPPEARDGRIVLPENHGAVEHRVFADDADGGAVLSVTLIGDADQDGALTLTDAEGATVGTVQLLGSDGNPAAHNEDGRYRFTPVDGYRGDAQFDYRVTDESGLSTTATMEIDIGVQPAVIAGAALDGGDHFSRTGDGTGSGTTFTHSMWFRRSSTTANDSLFGIGSKDDAVRLQIQSNGVLSWSYVGNGETAVIETPANRLSDTDWHHVVVAVDTTKTDPGDRVKIYLDGVEESGFAQAVYPTLGAEMHTAEAVEHSIGQLPGENASVYGFDGDLADVHYVDGVAQDAEKFGSFGEAGWHPQPYYEGHGNNGFHLDFADPTDLGKDAAGSNDLNEVGTPEAVPDTELGDREFHDFEPMDRLDVLDQTSNVVFSADGLTMSRSGASSNTIQAFMGLPQSGAYYFEMELQSFSSSPQPLFGLVRRGDATIGQSYASSYDGFFYNPQTAQQIFSGVSSNPGNRASLPYIDAAGELVSFAVDMENGRAWVGVRETASSPVIWAAPTGTSSDPSTGENPFFTWDPSSGDLYDFVFANTNNSGSWEYDFNFGQDPFEAGVPDGFVPAASGGEGQSFAGTDGNDVLVAGSGQIAEPTYEVLDTTGTGAIADGTQNGIPVSAVFDGQYGTYQSWQGAQNTTSPNWVGYDFGTGAAVTVDRLSLTRPSEAQSGSQYWRNGFTVEYSDDGSTWTSVGENYDLTGVVAGGTLTVDLPTGQGAHRYWRALVTDAGYQVYGWSLDELVFETAVPAEVRENATLTGGLGDDLLQGGTGGDVIDGGDGDDIAVFTGNIDGYTFSRNGDGGYTVRDIDDTDGDDGTDTVIDVETLRFADDELPTDDFSDHNPEARDGRIVLPEGFGPVEHEVFAEDMDSGSTLEITLIGDTDGDGALTVTDAEGATVGMVQLLGSDGNPAAHNEDGRYRFTPVDGYRGDAQFDYRVTDESGLSTTATMEIEIGVQPAVIAGAALEGGDHFSRTADGTGSGTTFTHSMWFRRSSTTANDSLFGIGSKDDAVRLQVQGNGVLSWSYVGNGETAVIETPADRLSDTDWHHVVVAVDTTKTDPDQRVRIYLDGVEESGFAQAVYPSQDAVMHTAEAVEHAIGQLPGEGTVYGFDGEIADVHYIDGEYLNAEDFGSFGEVGWYPQPFYGDHEGCSFHLDFADPTDLGKDAAGSNDLNEVGTPEAVPDTELGDREFHEFDPMDRLDVLDQTTNVVFSADGLTMSRSGASSNTVQAFMGLPQSGAYYFEMELQAYSVSPQPLFGLIRRGDATIGQSYASSYDGFFYNPQSAQQIFSGVSSNPGNRSSLPYIDAAGELVSFAVDMENGRAWVGVRETGSSPVIWAARTGTSSDPSTGDNPFFTWDPTSSDIYDFAFADTNNGGSWEYDFNFGQTPFEAGVPDGFVPADSGGFAGDGTEIVGTDGNDILAGGAGDDQITGGDGDDLLIGDVGQNLLSHSEDFTQPEFAKQQVGLTLDAGGGPLPGMDAYRLEDTTDFGFHRMMRSVTIAEAGDHVVSIYAKAAELTDLQFEMASGWDPATSSFETYGTVRFDLDAGTYGAPYGAVTAASIDDVGNGWFRLSAQMSFVGDGTFNVLLDNGSNYNYTGTGNDGLWLSGAQVESGTALSDYIATDGDPAGIDIGDDLLAGGMGNDSLSGEAGDDVLSGGAGDDVLSGGSGNDLFEFGLGDGNDSITTDGMDAASTDTLRFDAGISHNDLWFSQSGDDLRIDILGSDDSVTLEDWFASTTQQHLDVIEAGGDTLVEANVNQLVNAMATWSSQNAGLDGDDLEQMPADSELNSALLTAWPGSA